MALVFKSNIAAPSGLILPTVASIAQSPAQMAAEYTSRVTADGGAVTDGAAVTAAFTYLKDNDLLSRVAAIMSADWGVNADGSNFVSKAYSLVGTDFETVDRGSKPLLTTDGDGNNSILVDLDASRVGNLMQTESDITLSRRSDTPFAIVASMNIASRAACQIGWGNQIAVNPQGHTPLLLGRAANTNGYGQTSTYDPLAASDTGPRMLPAGAYGASDQVGVAILGDPVAGSVKIIVDGSVAGTVVSGTGSLFDYTSITRRLFIGSTYDGGANVAGNRGGHVRFAAALNAVTEDQVKALTSWVTSLY